MLKRKISPGFLAQLSMIPFVLIISSCGSDVNLAKVREFSQNAELAEKALPVIADDFYPSCLRSARYRAVNILPPQSTGDLSTFIEKDKLLEQIANLEAQLNRENPDSNLVQQIQDLQTRLASLDPPSNRLQARVDAQKKCNEAVQVSGSTEPQIPSRYLGELMKRGNSIIVLYMTRLGELATDDLINFDTEFNDLKANAQNLSSQLTALLEPTNQNGDIIKQQVGAGVDIANFILTQIFEGRRQETLSESITLANQPLKTYSKGLQTVVKRVYIDQYLDREEAFLNNYFIDYIQEILESKQRQEGNSVIALANTLISLDQARWNPQKDEIQKRRELAYGYIALLQSIVDSHEQLAAIYSNGQEPSPQALQKIMETNNQALKEFIDKAEALNHSRPIKK